MPKLYLVPTPIGNMSDITLRALEVLKEVDCILAEDTRRSSKLLGHFEIKKRLLAYHQHNEHNSLGRIIDIIEQASSVALISDAGTPGISDPGFLLVRECIKKNITIETLPGATALIPALINSGFPSERFIFEGFLPHKKGRLTRLQNLRDEKRTIIFYESPHRLLKTLKQLAELFGSERSISISRELSKVHEETIRGSVTEVIEYYENNPIKGEFVIILKGLDS